MLLAFEYIMVPNSIKLPNAFWLAIDKLQISRSALIKQAELPLAIAREDACMKTADYFKLWQALEQIGGSDIGFKLIASMDSGNMPPSFLVAYHAKDLRDAIQRVARYKSLCTPEELYIHEIDEDLSITIEWPFEDLLAPNALIDATLSSILSLAREGTATTVQASKIMLTRQEFIPNTIFAECPIQCNAEKNQIFFHQKDLALPFYRYNQELLKILDQALQSELQKLSAKVTISDQVKWLLRKSLTAGRPELRSVAKELAISERSLQRYLKNEGESFQSLLSKTRHELACEYLKDHRLDLGEIAYMLGYEEQASFFRSFQEWENTTPTKWREQQFNIN